MKRPSVGMRRAFREDSDAETVRRKFGEQLQVTDLEDDARIEAGAPALHGAALYNDGADTDNVQNPEAAGSQRGS